jgi:peptidoglycan-associated lipoprotein
MTCLLTGCKKKQNNTWEDNKTAGNYKSTGIKSFWNNGNEGISANQEEIFNASNEDFIPLREEDLKAQFADGAIPQSRETPGEEGGTLPGIEKFRIPSSQLASIFRNLFFNTDDHILRGQDSMQAVEQIAAYLKEHPETYVFVEGHCDQRGPEAYNLALGSRRANYIRSLLVQKGVNMDQVHTISYGKERPLDSSNTAQAWTKNRRAQFKIYQKNA